MTRAVGRSENPGGKQECGGHNLPPIEIGSTDLPKSRGPCPPPCPSGFRQPCMMEEEFFIKDHILIRREMKQENCQRTAPLSDAHHDEIERGIIGYLQST